MKGLTLLLMCLLSMRVKSEYNDSKIFERFVQPDVEDPVEFDYEDFTEFETGDNLEKHPEIEDHFEEVITGKNYLI